MPRKNPFFIFPVLAAVGVGGLLVALAGCRKSLPKAAEISNTARLEASNLASEAQFAVSIRDYARAEGLLVKATKLSPDAVEYWMALAEARRSSGQRGTAEKAYQQALDLYRRAAREDPAAPEPRMLEIFVLARLDREAEARAALAKAEKQFSSDSGVQAFVRDKRLDLMLAEQKSK